MAVTKQEASSDFPCGMKYIQIEVSPQTVTYAWKQFVIL